MDSHKKFTNKEEWSETVSVSYVFSPFFIDKLLLQSISLFFCSTFFWNWYRSDSFKYRFGVVFMWTLLWDWSKMEYVTWGPLELETLMGFAFISCFNFILHDTFFHKTCSSTKDTARDDQLFNFKLIQFNFLKPP